MVSIPLADVVAFLRPRGALGVLEGAPFFYSNGPTDPPMMPIPGTGMETWDGEPVRLLGHEHHAMLYLGDGEICPAAEGWAARVLALALCWPPGVRGMFGTSPQGVALFVPQGERLSVHHWTWASFSAWTRMSAPMPATPAERLAAVLAYEMECAK